MLLSRSLPGGSLRLSMVKILQVASANRWTGAAAPAFTEVEALRSIGVDAHYAYVGGHSLEERFKGASFTHPIIIKNQSPVAFLRSRRELNALIERESFDVVHAHLSHDHWLVHFVRDRRIKIVRTIHCRRVLRSDPFTRRLFRRTDGFCLVNSDLERDPRLADRPRLLTPPPVDHRQFRPDGASMRGPYDFGPAEPVIGFIGKVSPGRGFEDALRTFAAIRRLVPEARFMIIGRGPHKPFLERLSEELGISKAVTWAGYHEADLAEHYRTADLMLFTAAGSDEGHRAVSEAMACGTPVACYPIPGVDSVLGELAPDLMAGSRNPESLAAVAVRTLSNRTEELRARAVATTQRFSYEESARRLERFYASLLANNPLPASVRSRPLR